MRNLQALLLTTLISVPGWLAAQITFTEVDDNVISIPSNRSIISASLGDYDNDGDLDILHQGTVASGARNLYQNQLIESGSLSFIQVTGESGPIALDTTGWSSAWADLTGDGYPELFLGESNSSGARGDLFMNTEENGIRVFEDISDTTINEPGFHQNVAWADMNNDGLLDLVIGMEGPEMHEIYLQNDDFTFDQVGQQVGLHVPHGIQAYGTAIGDPDQDGDLDIYFSTCRPGGNVRNNFFVNNLIPDGTLSFTDIADTNETQYFDNSYHAEFQDFDNDGWVDLFMVGADAEDSKIWRNNQDGTWTDVDTLNGSPLLSNNGGDFNGGRAIDYDNDGDLDLFFHDHLATNGQDIARALYRNDGNWQFTDVTNDVGLLEINRRGYDSALGDIDNDGDIDLVTSGQRNGGAQVFLSNASDATNSLFIRLNGTDANSRGIGSKVQITIDKGTPDETILTRFANIQAGTFNQSDNPVHFGLGQRATAYDVTVHWPNGPTRNYGDIDVTTLDKGERVFLDINVPIDVKDGWVLN